MTALRRNFLPMAMVRLADRIWYGDHVLVMFLLPLSWGYRIAVWLRRFAYRSGLCQRHKAPVQVVVVGNIAVGGTGKTPMALWLARHLRSRGRRPGIVCSGYGGSKAVFWPQQVRADADASVVGDEAVLLAARSECPVVADPDRVRGINGLLRHHDVDIVICDDGMQHLQLRPDITISLVNGERRYGNGRCLPAGPMREPQSCLSDVDIQVCSGGSCRRGEYPMKRSLSRLVSLFDGSDQDLSAWRGRAVHAVAGVGNPDEFFACLRRAGIKAVHHVFPDHWRYRKDDMEFADELPVLMTEKDAVKYRHWAGPGHWFLPLEAEMGSSFTRYLDALLERNDAWREAATQSE